MTALLTMLRRARTLLWTALSIVIIVAAILVGVGKLLMPYSARYQPHLEAWLTREFGRPVVLESFTGEWNAFGPRLHLLGMRLKSPDEHGSEVAIAEAALDLKPLNAILPGRAWYNFLVIGADFSVVEGADGEFDVSGFAAGSASNAAGVSGLRNLAGIGELILEDSNLEYRHPGRGIRFKLTGINARVQLDSDSASLTLKADLEDEEAGRIFGEVEATALVRYSESGQIAEARWHFALQDLMLDHLEQRLPESRFLPQQGLVNGSFWGDWVAGRPLVVRGVADLRNGRLAHGDEVISVDHANSRLGWTYGGRGDWRLDLNELRIDDGSLPWHAPDIAIARDLEQGLGLWISAEVLPLDVSLQLARDVLALYGTAWPAFLPQSASGDVHGLELVLDPSWRMLTARGQARGAGVRAWGRWPGLAGLDADIDIADGEGSVRLHARALEIEWPGMFGEALRFGVPSCQADLQLQTGWQVYFRDCRLDNDDLALNGNLLLSGNENRPSIDANVEVVRGRLDRISPYWPQGVMKPKALGWLRSAIVAGEIEGGRVQIFGDMDDWPFSNGRGRFEAVAQVRQGTLDYAPGWPRAEGIEADLRFAGASMEIESRVGRVAGVEVQKAQARIGDFRRALLEVDYESVSDLPALIGFLRVSPVLAASDYALDRFAFAGPASTQGAIRLPLGKTPGQLAVDGWAQVQGGAFSDPESGVALTEITGTLRYDRDGLEGEGLNVRYRDRPALLDIGADPHAVERFHANLTGRFSVEEVLPEFLDDLLPLERLRGESEWRATLVVPASDTGTVAVPRLSVESQLLGITVDLPDPVAKAADQVLAMTLTYPLGGEIRLLELELENRARFAAELRVDEAGGLAATRVVRALVGLGDAHPDLPAAGFLNVQGKPDTFDLDGWIDVATNVLREDGAPGGLELGHFAMQIGEMRFLDRPFFDVGIGLKVEPNDVRADFSAESIAGHVLFTPGPRGGSLTAEFERLALEKPVSSGITMRSNPAELPELHLYARSFRYGGIEMGETRIEAYPVAEGFHFEKVEARSDSLNLRASGDWLMGANGPRSDFRILVTTEALGEFLESVGISASLSGGQTVLRFNAWWPGPPAAFALPRLNGEVEFSISRGQITTASAGTGRLLGLLSIQALPRRLALDFRDVFDSGFDFEEAHGTFRMENGMASTEDVELVSSAARISLRGTTDLVAQQYDQVMTVQPGVGNTLPVIGAIAGGPGGAAAGLALQGLLHRELGQATQVRYTITGSWEEPSIEPVLRDGAQAPPVADGP